MAITRIRRVTLQSGVGRVGNAVGKRLGRVTVFQGRFDGRYDLGPTIIAKLQSISMLKFDSSDSAAHTFRYLAGFPRFSLAEKMTPLCFPTPNEAAKAIAQIIRQQIQAKNAKGELFVLGLATGVSPLPVYAELVKMYRKGALSFKGVAAFNLDEFYPLSNSDPCSQHAFMQRNFLELIDILPGNCHMPSGELPRSQITAACARYDQIIKEYGGIDLQLLGIGRSGHIGFNEPPASVHSTSRLVCLHRLTRKEMLVRFGSLGRAPKRAVTLGLASILSAKKIILMAWSEGKADIIRRSIEGELDSHLPATFLQRHPDVSVYLDQPASSKLTRFQTHWLIKGDIQDPIVPRSHYWVLKSVVWLSQTVQKPLLRLSYLDYEEHHLAPLVMQCANGNVEDLNLYCYRKIVSKITGWPLGHRPLDCIDNEIITYPKKAQKTQRVLVFSPHPDDDVIAMGATLHKLHQQGHQIHIAYLTSGAKGVYSHQIHKYLLFLKDYINLYFSQVVQCENTTFLQNINRYIDEALAQRDDAQTKETILAVRRYIRSSEAKIAIGTVGVQKGKVNCLQLPFYERAHRARTVAVHGKKYSRSKGKGRVTGSTERQRSPLFRRQKSPNVASTPIKSPRTFTTASSLSSLPSDPRIPSMNSLPPSPRKFMRTHHQISPPSSLNLLPTHSYLPPITAQTALTLPIGKQDFETIISLLKKIKPTAIYLAGDLTNPQTTHYRCLRMLLHLFDEQEKKPVAQRIFPPADRIFLYRSEGEEWSIPAMRVIVPLSPKDVRLKAEAISRHQSHPTPQGDEAGELGQTVKARNRATADLLHKLGFIMKLVRVSSIFQISKSTNKFEEFQSDQPLFIFEYSHFGLYF